jgi:N-acetylglucosaminyldiphosphoundecaprenol N-acetyl-beta-D-mannosaminyltransferase
MGVMNSASLPFSSEATRNRRPSAEGGAKVGYPAHPVAILGVPLEPIAVATAVERIDAAILRARPFLAVAVDLPMIAAKRRWPDLQQLLAENDLGVCGSRLLRAAGRLASRGFAHHIDGATLRASLLQLAATRGYRVFLLGADPNVVITLQRDLPLLQIVGFDGEANCNQHAGALLRRITEGRTQLVLVASCNAAYVKWLAANRRKLNAAVCLCEFTADRGSSTVPRDYLHHVHSNWRRWTATMRQPIRELAERIGIAWNFISSFAREAARWSRCSTEPLPGPAVTSASNDWLHIDAGADLTRSTLETHAEVWRLFAHRATHWALDLSRVQRIDATGVAFLLRGRNALRADRHQLVLVGAPILVRSALAAADVDFLFNFADTDQAARQSVADQRASPSLERGQIRSLAWCGEIVAANVDDVWQMTIDYVRTFTSGGASLVTIDLERLRFIDSAGAGLMIRVKKWARELPVEIMFAHAQTNVRQMLRLTRLEQLLLEGDQ